MTLSNALSQKFIELTLTSIQNNLNNLESQVFDLKDDINSCRNLEELAELQKEYSELKNKVAQVIIPTNAAESGKQQEWRILLEERLNKLNTEFL